MGSATRGQDGLKERRNTILDRWKALALDVYPERAARFIDSERDRFQNPVGHALYESLGSLLDGLLGDVPTEEMREALDGVIRVRAVQDMPASAAVGFVFLLKRAAREVLGEAGEDDEGLLQLEDRIDRLALLAFDQYARCREQIYDLRLREVRGRTSKLFERLAGRYTEDPASR